MTFTVYELLKDDAAIDLTDPDAWVGLADVVVSGVGDQCSVTTPGYSRGGVVGSGVTNEAGETTIAVDSIGAYVVCETAAPSTVTDPANPFIVTIPFPWAEGWIYDVNVYPKNGVTEVVKTIVEQDGNGIGLGSVVQFPVTVTIPTIDDSRDFTSFDIVDTLDPRLTPVPAADDEDAAGDGVAHVRLDGVDVDADLFTVSVVEQRVEVSFNIDETAVQTWLKANAGATIEVLFQGTVDSLGDGEIDNTAIVFINDPDHDEETAPKSNEVTTNWGDIRILKVDSSDEEATLEGAVFQVYAAVSPHAGSCEAAVPTGDPLSVLVGDEMVDEFTSDADGVVHIPGLFVSDSENAPVDAQTRCYVVVEIKAPAGFLTPEGVLAQFPIEVSIGATADVEYDGTVENTQQDVPTLPLTGSVGQAALVYGGGTLLLAAVVMFVVRSRRAVRA